MQGQMSKEGKKELDKYDRIISKDPHLKWLNSKGFSTVKVKCAKCKSTFETVIQNVRKNFALKYDTFICENC